MAFGSKINVDTEESALSLGADRTISGCTGMFPNGAIFEVNAGEISIKGPSAPTAVPADEAQKREVIAALEKRYGARRIELNRAGLITLRDTPAPTVVDAVASAAADRARQVVKNTLKPATDFVSYNNRTARARKLGILSFVREQVDANTDPAQILADAENRFPGTTELEELVDVSIQESTDAAKKEKAAVAFIKTNNLVNVAAKRIAEGEGPDEVFFSISEGIKNAGSFERAPGEVRDVMDQLKTSTAAKVDADRKAATAKRNKRNRQNRWDSYVPGTKEFKWDELLRKQGIVSTIRFLRSMGVDDNDIGVQLENELEQLGIPRAEEIIDYAFSRVESEGFKDKAAKRYITDRELDAVVSRALNLGVSRDDITEKLKSRMDADNRDPAEVKQIIDAAFERADAHHRKMRIKSGLKSIVPLTAEFGWDNFLIDKGIHTKIRKLIATGKNYAEIRNILITDPELQHHPKQDAIIEYALDTHETVLTKQAYREVKTKKLAAKVVELEDQTPPLSAEEIKAQIAALITGNPEQEEIDAIVAAAFDKAHALRNRKKAWEVAKTPFVKSWEGAKWTGKKVRDTVIPGALTVPGKMWNFVRKIPGAMLGAPSAAYNWVKANPDTAKTVAKYGALGVVIAGVSTAALGVGALLAGGYVLKKAAPLALNVGKHLVTDGVPLVKAVAQTAIVNPIKATGRIISTPFKRGYQAARWATNYITKPNEKKPKGWLKPFTWMNNKLKRTWYRSKQATLALAAGSLFSIYGAGEGIVNAASKDLIGLNAEVPELAVFHAPSGGHGGHGGDGGHDSNDNHDNHGADHGHGGDHGAAHGGGHH